MNLTPIYAGGSRNLPYNHAVTLAISQFCRHLQSPLHVGCQSGADQWLVMSQNIWHPSNLFVFAVPPNLSKRHLAPSKLQNPITPCPFNGSAKAMYLLRSITAFKGCHSAIFFQPGTGSLAVAREFIIREHKPIFAIATEEPAPVPGIAGEWQYQNHSFYSNLNPPLVSCWAFMPAQIKLF